MMMSFVALGVVGVVWALLGYSLAFAPGNAAGRRPRHVRCCAASASSRRARIPHLLFMAYPGHVRDHHRGADLGRDRRAHALQRLHRVHHAVGARRLRAGRALGVGRRLARDDGRARLRRRHGRARERRRRRRWSRRIVVGPRKDYARQAILPHNVPFTLLGAGLLWFGWFGFNAGSALAAEPVGGPGVHEHDARADGHAGVWTLLDLTRNQKVTAVGAATAIVVGLVAITPAAGFVGPMSALALGALAAVPSYFALIWRARTRLDDSLDVVAAHGVGGTVGALLTGVFAEKAWNGAADGLLVGNPAQLGIQAVARRSLPSSTAASRRSCCSSSSALVMPLRADGARRRPRHGRQPARRRGLRGGRRRDPRAARSRGVPRRSAGRWRRKEAAHEADRRNRPARAAERVLEALFRAEVRGLTISRVQGHGGETRARRDLPRHDGEDGAVREGAPRDRRLGPLRRADGEGDPRAAPAPATSATARSSCCRSRRSSASAPARRIRPRSRRSPSARRRRRSAASHRGWRGGRRDRDLASASHPASFLHGTGRGGFVMRSDSSGLLLPWQGLVAGAVGGFVASWAMEQFQARFSQSHWRWRSTRGSAGAATRRPGRPAHRIRRAGGRPATVRTADVAAGATAGRRLLPVRAGRCRAADALRVRHRRGRRVRRAGRDTSRADATRGCAIRARRVGQR